MRVLPNEYGETVAGEAANDEKYVQAVKRARVILPLLALCIFAWTWYDPTTWFTGGWPVVFTERQMASGMG